MPLIFCYWCVPEVIGLPFHSVPTILFIFIIGSTRVAPTAGGIGEGGSRCGQGGVAGRGGV